jgi:hypothetical protein
LCIFQLPATNGRRPLTPAIPQRDHAGQRLALDQLERGAASRRDVGDVIGHAGHVDGGHGVAAAHHRGGVRAGHSAGHRQRTLRERLQLEHAHRPVPEDRLGGGQARRVQLGRGRADVEPHPAVGDLADRHHPRLGVGGESIRHHHVAGQQQPAAALTGVAHRRPRDRLAVLVLVPRRAHREAVRDQEGEGHGASDQDRIGQLGEAVDDPDLVGHLDTADHHHERPRRAVQQAREGVQLGLQQQPRRRRQLLRDSHRGGVRAVHRPEGVLHEQVGVGGQLGREAGIVGLLARVEAQVLEHPQLALLIAEGDLAPKQLGQPLRHRPQRQLRLGLALGPAQV